MGEPFGSLLLVVLVFFIFILIARRLNPRPKKVLRYLFFFVAIFFGVCAVLLGYFVSTALDREIGEVVSFVIGFVALLLFLAGLCFCIPKKKEKEPEQ